MGFPSPAKDYLDNRLDWNELMVPRPAATMVVPTADGFALVDKSIRPKEGDTVYFEAFGLYQLGLFGSHYIICQDGDALEGETLEEVTIVGVQTWGVVSVHDDNRPTI
ncbi:hypothetical protein [Pantoea sp. At-9b]|uniref:hypothetical protein n=1 Tax=Pantoea sp. (strain At-9b) TaxID=592316 RepID=UPI0001B3E531|nr:hypothetical protein [Pantoea sp. At-9b]ADU71570.1 conserved hypothetical protein [Pantoea sp. At-9b]